MAIDLGGLTLEHLTYVAVKERARTAYHPVPGLSGDLAQPLGRSSVEVHLRGIFIGDSATDDMNKLRQLFTADTPQDFFTEAVGEGFFAKVLITEIQVAQNAGYLDQFDYACTVVEYVEPPAPAPADLFGDLNAGLLDEAAGFMDDVQNALDTVSQLADLVANVPSFGDPTQRLSALLDGYQGLLGSGSDGLGALGAIRDLF
jgi:hypothetical protein